MLRSPTGLRRVSASRLSGNEFAIAYRVQGPSCPGPTRDEVEPIASPQQFVGAARKGVGGSESTRYREGGLNRGKPAGNTVSSGAGPGMTADAFPGSRLEVFQGILPVRRQEIWRDMLAGVTLAALGIPELGSGKIFPDLISAMSAYRKISA